MRLSDKVDNMLDLKRDEKEIQRWIFSLIPLGVAFVFFFIFMLPMEIANKDVILVMAAAAGFAGLQTFWIFRGWRRAETLTIVLGVIGIVIAAVFVWSYIAFLGEILREIIKGWAS
jgi:ABC-type proline/glycine betaine transport system permease subunit